MIKNFVRRGFRILLAAAALACVGAPSQAADKTDTERKAIEDIVHDYLLSHPEVVIEAIRKYQAEQEAQQAAQQSARVAAMREPLERAKTTPVIGNPDGDVTLVEFFDYRCGYCKRAHEAVSAAVKDDGKVRLVLKEFPILGPDSVFASRAALGVFFMAPDKYPAFHEALMTARGTIDENRVMDIAVSVGLDADKVKEGMKDARVNQEIQHTMALAQALDITGTPAFVIGTELVPGAVDKATLDELIKKARGG